MSDNDPQSEPLDVISRLEALLFVASTPITPSQIADVLELSTKEVEDLLNELIVRYKGRESQFKSMGANINLQLQPSTPQMLRNFWDWKLHPD